jgi:hypothetical protein
MEIQKFVENVALTECILQIIVCYNEVTISILYFKQLCFRIFRVVRTKNIKIMACRGMRPIKGQIYINIKD